MSIHMQMGDLCSEDGQRVCDKKIVVWCHRSKKIVFCVNFLFEHINHIRTAAHGHPQ